MKKSLLTVFSAVFMFIAAILAVSCGGGGGGAIAATGGNNKGKHFGSGTESGSKIQLTSNQLFSGETASMMATTSYDFIRLKVSVNGIETIHQIQKGQNIELNIGTTIGDKLQMYAEICDASGTVLRTATSDPITVGLGTNNVVMYIIYKAKLHHADGTTTEYSFTSLGSTLPADSATYPIDGYVFNSWSSENGGGGTLYNSIAPNTRKDMEFYAYWTPGNGAANVANVTFSRASGNVAYNSVITLACATPGATIYYTTDGSEPSESSTVYTAAGINITENNTTVKAMAVHAGQPNSVVTSAVYRLTPVTITYETDYFTAPEAITVIPNTPLTAAQLPALAEDGYYIPFNGWKNGAESVSAGSRLTEDTTLTADWGPAGTLILTNANYNTYTSANIAAGTEICIDSSISATNLDDYFRYTLSGRVNNLTINMKYYINPIPSLWFWNVATKIILPDNTSSLASQAFQSADNLVEIEIDAANTNYCTVDGILYNKAMTTIVKYPQNKAGSSFTLPPTVRIAGYGAFEDTRNLTDIPNFNIVTSIADMATFSSSSVTRLELNDAITSLPMYTFQYSKLETITLPASLSSIGANSFRDCSSLTSVTFKSSTAPTLSSANNYPEFSGCNNLQYFYVPTGAENAYKTASSWNNSSTNAKSGSLDAMVVPQP